MGKFPSGGPPRWAEWSLGSAWPRGVSLWQRALWRDFDGIPSPTCKLRHLEGDWTTVAFLGREFSGSPPYTSCVGDIKRQFDQSFQ